MQETYISRVLDIKERLRTRSVLLLGPRQTGKTSYMRNELNDSIAMEWDLLKAGIRRRAEKDPEILGKEIKELGITADSGIVVIDEIQKVPELLDEVHSIIEDKKIRFLLTGSSARKLKKSGVNLLGGRASQIKIHPFVYRELTELGEKNLEEIFLRGMLPQSWFESDPDSYLDDYAETYMREEVALEGLVRNLPAFYDFLKISAMSSGEEINYTNIANDIQMSAPAVSGWFQILEDTMLGYLIRPWTKSKKRKAVKTAKFYLFDVGLTRNLSGIDVPSDNQSDYGRLFENFIAMELKAWLDYSGSREELTFWRTERGTREVDFLIGDRIAIEVKSARRIKSSHLTGLHAIMEEKQFEKLIVVCREDIPYRTDEGFHILPWRFFLDKLWGGFLNHQ